MSYNMQNNSGMDYNPNSGNTDFNVIETSNDYVAKYTAKVFAWMFLGLVLTAVASLVTALVPGIQELVFSNRLVFFGLILLNLGIVIFISARFTKMSYATLVGSFLLYSIIEGLVFSFIFAIYDFRVITTSFGITAVTFGIMSIVGYTTKTDLTNFGRLLMMALVGIIIASVINLFLGSETLYWIVSYVGVAIFVGLIAYDTQKIKSYAMIPDAEMRRKAGIMGALSLYLDFINLFLLILRIFGNRR